MLPKGSVDSPHVCLILHKFSAGGSDRVAAYLARGFTTLGMRVTLLVVSRGGEVEDLLTSLVGEDIPIRFLGKSSGRRGWGSGARASAADPGAAP